MLGPKNIVKKSMSLSTTVHWWYLVFKKIHCQSSCTWTEFNKAFFVDDIHTDKNITIAADENGTEWKPTSKNETEDNQEGSGLEGNMNLLNFF